MRTRSLTPLLLLLLCVVAVSKALNISVQTFPKPSLHVYSYREAFYVGDPVFFDVSDSVVPDPTGPAYFLYQFGAVDAYGINVAWKVQTISPFLRRTSSSLVSFSYTLPGTYVAQVALSDQPFGAARASGAPPIGVTSMGHPAPVAAVKFTVLPREDCYYYSLRVDWNPSTLQDIGEPYAGKSAVAYLSVFDQTKPDSVQLTSAFRGMGDIPTVKVRNGTSEYALQVNVDEGGSGWMFDLPAHILGSTTALIATATSTGTALMSCSISPSTFDISVTYMNSLLYGMDMAKALNGLQPGLDLISKNYRPLYLRHSRDECSPKENIIVLGSRTNNAGSREYLGGMVLISGTGFERDNQLRDLLRGPDGSRSSIYSLCNTLTDDQCRELLIYDSIVIDGYVFLHTSRGLFYTQNNKRLTVDPMQTTFTRANTKVSVLDSTTADYTNLRTDLTGSRDCTELEPRYLYLIYANAPDQTASNLIITTTKDIINDVWSEPIRLSSLLGSESDYSFIRVVGDHVRDVNVILAGKLLAESGSDCIMSKCKYNNVIILRKTGSLENGSEQTIPGFVFPPDSIFSDMVLDPFSLQLYAFGSELWISYDGGTMFHKAASLTSDDYFKVLQTSPNEDSYALETENGLVYYGRSAAKDLAPIRTRVPPPGADPHLFALTTNYLGGYFWLRIDYVSAYPNDSSMYPIGFLKSIDGTLRDGDNSYVTQSVISVKSFFPSTDLSITSTLVPSQLGYHRLRFYIYDSITGDAKFETSHLGNVIKSRKATGSALIKSFNIGRTMADCLLLEDFPAETTSQSPALAYSLQLYDHTMQGTTVPDFSGETPPSLQPVLLGLGNLPNGEGWNLNDVEKTVIYMKGSIIITSIINSTFAAGMVFVEPIGSVALVAGPSEWQMYDFRGQVDRVQSNTKSLSVTLETGNTFKAQVPLGEVTFSEKLLGQILTAGQIWGVVTDVLDDHSLLLGTYDVDAQGNYNPGNWSIYAPEESYIWGATPDSASVPNAWTLGFDVCRWTSFTSTAYAKAEYMGHTQTFTMNATSQAVGTPGFVSSMLSSSSALSALSYYRVSDKFAATVGAFDYDSRTNSIFVSVASWADTTGRSVLGVRPTVSSLMCPPSMSLVTIIENCPPTKQLDERLPYTDEQLIDANMNDAAGEPLITIIPVNYRPPSYLGKAIPLSSNVYNADPSQPRYRNNYAVSKATGSFKQCAGKENRADCGCSQDQRLSSLVEDSDCMDRVPTVRYEKFFHPNITILEIGQPTLNLDIVYRIKEVNNRTDYCFTYLTACTASMLVNATIDPTLNQGITWQGEELYHFHVEAQYGAFCWLETDFKVWVINGPLKPSIEQSIMASTAVAFCALLFVVYLVYSYQHSSGGV